MESNQNNFKIGDLIVPNNNIDQAFYLTHDDVFYDSVEYRLATSSEFIYHSKYVESDIQLNTNISKYISNGNNVASEHNKSRRSELSRYNKLHQSLNRKNNGK